MAAETTVIYIMFLKQVGFYKQPQKQVWQRGSPIRGLHMLHWAPRFHKLYLCSAELSGLHLVPYFPATLSVTASLPHCFSWKAGRRYLPTECAWWFIGAGRRPAALLLQPVVWTGVARTGLSSCELNSSGALCVCVCAHFHGFPCANIHSNEQEHGLCAII